MKLLGGDGQSLFGQPDESISTIQVGLNILGRHGHFDLIVAQCAGVLSLDDAMMEFPKRLVGLGELLSESGDDGRMLRVAQPAAEQKSLRNIEHGVVGAGDSEIEIPVGIRDLCRSWSRNGVETAA